jgi:hypothetical protein
MRSLLLLTVLFLTTISPRVLTAQDDWDYEPGPDNKFNSNIGFAMSSPVNPMANFAHFGWGLTYGAGYNISRHHSLIGEIMWNRLYPTSEALAPIRLAMQSQSVDGHGDLLAITGNYRLQFQGKVIGTYFIVGGGMYYRDAVLSHPVTTSTNFVSCNPEWLWWGFTCTAGQVTSDQTIASSSSFAPGGNGGIGITFRLPDSWWKIYLEARYHYAENKSVHTHIIPVVFGIRF